MLTLLYLYTGVNQSSFTTLSSEIFNNSVEIKKLIAVQELVNKKMLRKRNKAELVGDRIIEDIF